MWHRAWIPIAVLAPVATLAVTGVVFADAFTTGTFTLTSRQGTNRPEVKLWVDQVGSSETYRITRQEVYRDGTKGPITSGEGTVSRTGWLRVKFSVVGGITGVLVGNQPASTNYEGTYKVWDNGRKIRGYYRGPDRSGRRVSVYETGARSADEPRPDTGGNGGGSTPATSIRDLQAQVTKLEVTGDIRIVDAGEVNYERGLGAEAPSKIEPSAILKGERLQVRLTLAARNDAAPNTRAKLTGMAGSRKLFEQDVTLGALRGSGQTIALTSLEAVSAKVAINQLDLSWKLDDVDVGTSPVRIYTSHAQPIKNIAWDQTQPATKRHFENACRWANGASRNIGQGADSIAHQIDNQMRHYVHWQNLGNAKPAVPDYPEGAAAPTNYGDLSGWVNNGTRSISSLYYPPLEPRENYEEYTHYRSNFGWWLLDNPTHVGGRCNQQAALVCAINGTVGIKGQVLYLERTGRGKRTGRPVRQYFYAQGGGGPWNFHGVALIDLDDGSQWIYDGSFSSPPNRKNGTREWAQDAGGPFIGSWADWYYEDFGGKAPADDHPDTWQGVP